MDERIPVTHQLRLEIPGAAAERRDIAEPTVAGGSRADALHLRGAPPGALRLVPCAAGVVVEAAAPGARVAGHPVAPGARRLMRPGERAEMSGASIALLGPESSRGDTRIAAAALLGGAAAGAAPPLGACVVVLTGPRAGARDALGAGRTIGRGREADVRIPDPRASRVHARIRVEPSGMTVEDLRSKNGVFVNGVRADRGHVPVRPGDEIRIGDTSLAIGEPPGAGDASERPRPPPARRRRASRHAAAAALLALCAAALALAAP